MSLFEREAFELHIAALPGVTVVRQWGDASVGKVGGKIFALLSDWSTEAPAISFKCSEIAFLTLPELDGVRPAPYLARARWVQVLPGAPLTEAEIAAYIAEAHRLIAEKLPRVARAGLGL